MTYVFLCFAIIVEVIATLFLKASNGWEKVGYGSTAAFLYVVSGILFSIVLKNMGVGVAYAIWSGMGIALVTAASVVFFKQTFDFYAIAGILMIISGTLIITLKSSVVIQ